MVSSARILELDFAVTRYSMSSQLIGAFPELAATGTLKRFTVTSEIFYVRGMLLAECFRSGGASGGGVWRRCQVSFLLLLLLLLLHRGSVWRCDCTLEY